LLLGSTSEVTKALLGEGYGAAVPSLTVLSLIGARIALTF
jgi:hypothetical protein